jgi:hypothetical protein
MTTMTEHKPLTDRDKSLLGFLYGPEPQPVSRIAVAFNTTKGHAHEMVTALLDQDLVRRISRPDKPYFLASQAGREAAI